MHSVANQYFNTKETYLAMTSRGIIGVFKPRPIDELYPIISSKEFKKEKIAKFIKKFGYTEVNIKFIQNNLVVCIFNCNFHRFKF